MTDTTSIANVRYRRGIQMALNEKLKLSLVIDGDLGPKSVAALKTYQKLNNLPVSGSYDQATRQALHPFIDHKYLNDEDFASAAAALGVDVASVETVVEVEAGGDCFLPSGDCDILFERHIFHKQLSRKRSAAEVAKLAAQYPELISVRTGGYLGGQSEWKRLNQAIAIDRTAALLSASWGMFQVMGFNYTAAGYTSLEQFVKDMMDSEKFHLKAFTSFVKSNAGLLRALKAKDWANFARGYNGPAYAKNRYDVKLAAAYAKFSKKK